MAKNMTFILIVHWAEAAPVFKKSEFIEWKGLIIYTNPLCSLQLPKG